MNGRLALSRALGDFEYKNNADLSPKKQAVSAHPDLKMESITADTQFIILACDGIWDVLTSQEAVNWVHKNTYKSTYSTRRRKISEL